MKPLLEKGAEVNTQGRKYCNVVSAASYQDSHAYTL